jgi:hypothetical protein
MPVRNVIHALGAGLPTSPKRATGPFLETAGRAGEGSAETGCRPNYLCPGHFALCTLHF